MFRDLVLQPFRYWMGQMEIFSFSPQCPQKIVRAFSTGFPQ
jgi:hypothetical protein